jgi:murein DD-endopeptidase
MSVRMATALAVVLAVSVPRGWCTSAESFDVVVPTPPSPNTIDAREWLVYELHLTNFSREPIRLKAVEVLSDRGVVLQRLADADLDARIALAGAMRGELQPVQPGERAIVYLEVPMSTGHAAAKLRHRVRYESTKAIDEIVGGETVIRPKARLALGPPLRGGPWAAVYAWEWPRGHRRVFYTLDGRARLPGRLAIDWVRQDEEGNLAHGDADVVKNSFGYGADVLAVADARVAAVRDGILESERVSANPKHALDDAAGNYVSLDLGDGRFAIYEHLVPGSIRVARGDRVRRGQVLASLGFTGDSTGPHLHFHVADSPLPLSGEGVPFELEQFRVVGAAAPGFRKHERPAPNAVVVFE